MRNLEIIDELTLGTPIHRLHSEGGWSVILQVPRIFTEEEWITRLLTEHGVIVQPGYFFDMPREAYLVVSLLTPEPDLREGFMKIHSMATRQ